MSENEVPQFDSCIVVGAGIGGLAAAASMADRCKRVIVIEKGSLDNYPKPRKSVVQAKHLHSLLIAGQESLEGFFPGITDELKAAGAVGLRAGLDQSIHEFGQWMPKRDLGSEILAQSRTLLDFIVKKRLSQLSNVEVIDSARVDELTLKDGAVTGVVVSQKGSTVEYQCNFLVDASGLSGTLAKRLNRDYPAIEEKKEVVSSKIVYVTAFIKKPQEWLATKENVLIIAEPSQTCGGALLDIEGDTWVVSLNGRNGVEPPTDLEQWKEYARQLASPAIWERIKDCTVELPLSKFSKPLSYLRRFDRVEGLPVGYFPLGDTINSVNPTFGQGMTLALGHADFLGASFTSNDLAVVQQEYIKKATQWSLRAWRQTVAYESMFTSGTDEKTRRKFKILESLVLSKHKQAISEHESHLQLFRQAQMLE